MPGTENEDTIIASGTGYSKLDYQVALKDNDIYDEQMISDQDYYLNPFTKYIKFYATAGLDAAGADKVLA